MSRKNASGTRRCGIMIAFMVSSLVATLIMIPEIAGALDRPIGQALQFGIGSDFTLRQFDGATIAYLHYRGHDRAWRASVDLNVTYDDGDATVDFWDGHVGADVSHDQTHWDQSLGAGFECLWYRGEAVSVFFGGGPRVTFTSGHDESWYYHLGAGWEKGVRENNDFAAGVRGCLGIQWAATRWLAIHAEYNAQAMYHRKVRKDLWEELATGQHNNETIVSNGLSVSSLGVRFGLSAYF